LWSLAFLPFALAIAWIRGVPGMGARVRCIAFGLRALVSGDVRRAFTLIVNPMDSFRYFEYDFALQAVRNATVARYLDVSSPRLLPFMVLASRPDLEADMLNPSVVDLKETSAVSASLGLAARCRYHSSLIDDVVFADGTFDLITTISVVEHITEDTRAIATMWRLLRPEGKLVITVPCAREACEEYTNIDEYGLLAKDKDGFVYWQRYYDQSALADRIWSVTGAPARMRIYGERRAGTYDENVERKRTDPSYEYWREPILMADGFSEVDTFEQLPGMGVVAMEFVKPSTAQRV